MSDQRPWLKHYPSGIPANIDADKYPNLGAFLDDVLKKYSTLPAFTSMGVTLTFEQVDQYSTNFAAYLHSRGLEPGDRFGVMMPNLLQYPIALFGLIRAGLIIVNTNPLYTPREMKHQFTDAGVKGILIAENFCHNLEEILPDTPIKTVIVTSIGEMLGFKGKIINFILRYFKRIIPKYHIENTASFKDALSQGAKFKPKAFNATSEDVVALQYTGGTTGVAKGAMLTHRNLIANMEQMRAVMLPYLKEKEEIVLTPLPLYHIFGFTVNLLGMMSMGARNILIVNARDLPALIKEWKKYPISVMTGVNTLFNALLNNDSFKEVDFSTLKLSVGGAMAVQKAVAERWNQTTGCTLAEGYGMTESSPVASVNPLDGTARLGTIGMPAPSTDMRAVDDAGNPLPVDGVGELQIKGPQVMKGYYNRPEATAETIKDGWLCTGDIGFMNADGFFQIVDRKKDMILVSGFNVYPNEIEDVLAAHPKVLESAAIGIPDEKSGEVVKVFIVKKDNSLTEEEVLAHCKENLTGYKIPKAIEFRKELPKTNVGKILRRELRG